MITIVYNEVLKAIEFNMDVKGIDLLIDRLNYLKVVDGDHIHVYTTNDDCGLSSLDPYRAKVIFKELILGMLPAEAWEDAAAADGRETT